MFKKIPLKLAFFALLFFVSEAMAIDITVNNNADALVGNIFGGDGVSIVAGSAKYTGAAGASGTFTGGGSSIGIDSGIILTSGSAKKAEGPNTSTSTTGNNGLGGDAQLDSLIPGYKTLDATTLEFDFTTESGDMYFNYVFASEEYNEWVNTSFNDVFGFFVDNVNVALVPGTDDPVSINSVNNGNPYGDPTATNPGFYTDNNSGLFDIEYDGFTAVFTAKIFGLDKNQSHHISMKIADAGDRILDSGVFIQAGTFQGTNPGGGTEVPEPGTMLLLGSGLMGIVGRRRKKKEEEGSIV